MRKRLLIRAAGLMLFATLASTTWAADRMLGVVPSDGTTMLVKEFSVTSGTIITGAQFENNDPATVFPEVQLIRGPVAALSEGEIVASVTNVQESSGGLVNVLWPSPVSVTTESSYYVGVRLPNGPGKQGPGDGPAIGSNDVIEPNGSYVTECEELSLLPLRQDLAIGLVTSGGPAGKASPDQPVSSRSRPFIRAYTSAAGVMLEFSLKQGAKVSVGIYDVTGRRVRTLIREDLPAGTHQRVWDGRDEHGTLVGAGIYFVKLQAPETSLTTKVVKVE